MHFRLYKDVEFGMGKMRWRDDFLGLMPFESNARSTQSSTSKPSSATTTTTTTKASESVQNAALQDPAHHPQPKRVSFTAEETAIAATLASYGNERQVSAETPLQVAEILRQMSQTAGAPAIAPIAGLGPTVESIHLKKKRTPEPITIDDAGIQERMKLLQMLAKRKLPLPTDEFKQDPHQETAESLRAAKRVRWQPPAASGTSAMAPSVEVEDTLSEKSSSTASEGFIFTPVIKPIPGLRSYDIIIGRAFISHFNRGNRRLLVLAWARLEQFIANSAKARDVIVNSLYGAIRHAGGRFVVFIDSSRRYEDVDEMVAKAVIGQILIRQQEHQRKGKSFMQMFHKDSSSIWGGEEQSCDDEDKKPAANPELKAPTEGDLPEGWSPKCPKKLEPMTPLGLDFRPGPFDVICCRGSQPRKHPGNMYFVSLVEQTCERYTEAEGKQGKSVIVSEILDIVRKNSPKGGFVKLNDTGNWCEIGDHLAREKIGQCFRDRLHTRYSSSSKSKLQKRRNSKSSDDGSEI